MRQAEFFLISWWNIYQKYVRGNLLPPNESSEKSISYWRNEMFFRALIYFTPLSIIALIPGVYMSFANNATVVGIVDLLAFFSLIVILVNRRMSINTRKLVFISVFYMLSIVLIYYIGKAGPGLLFLLAITLFSSIIYSYSAGYYSAWANTFICFAFGMLNFFGADIPVVNDYSLGTWIAVTSNLVLLSFACSKSVNFLLKGLTKSLQDNKMSEEKLNKTNRLYQFISQINQSIVHTRDEQALFRKSCQIAFDIGNFKMAWITRFDGTGNRVILIDHNGIPEMDVHLFTTSIESGGPQDYVLRTGSYYVCNDIKNDPRLRSREDLAVVPGIQSYITLPVKSAGLVIGTFNLCAAEVGFFDGEEIRLLEEATGDISFALDVFEKEGRHKKAEQLIENNERRFRALVENGTDAVAILSPLGGVLYISSSIQRMLGYTEREAMKLDLFSLIHPDDAEHVAKVWELVMANPGVPIPGYTGRMRHKDGSWRWLEAVITNMLHEPSINGIVDNFRDVTEKVRLNERQDFNSNNLDALINNTTDLMWSVDRDFNLITSNQTFNKIIGVVQGANILAAALSEEQSARFKACYERAFAGETFTEYEYGTVPEEHWLETSFCPIRKGEEIIGTACYSRNITERKISEQKLIKSEARLTDAQAIARMGNWEVDFKTQESIWSEEACKIYGLTLTEKKLMYSDWVSFIHPEDLDYVMSITDQAQKTLSDIILNHRIVLEDGSIKHIYAKSKFKLDENGKPSGLYGIVLDVTDRKQAEEEREKMITNIIQHSKNLEQFASIVSHNLRAPVANILGLANVLKTDISETDRARSQQFLFHATEQLDKVFKDLNKILQVRSEINEFKEPVCFRELVDTVKSSIHTIIDKEAIQIVTNFSAVEKISSFKSYIHSVFYNLILNSIKYRQADKPLMITIISEVKNEKVVLSFRDNGIGIDLDKHGDKIFGLYKRFHLDIEGKGMGLFMIKTQIETLGGEIRVRSKPEEGAEFIVELPL
ncbi:MAG: hypothetical protein K0S33_2976 [Bacteroidetes bacterium]|jgi:PAS domain S-box-containing protein|nr:hypothetical protein [Bacteroidota bacterium]